MELYIFNQDEQPLTVISEETGLIDTHYRIEINGIPDEPFIFSVEADDPTAAYVKEENKVIFRDIEGDWRLMTIREVDDSRDMYGPITLATCEPVSIAELNDNITEERRFSDQPAEVALEAALQGTRWQASVEVELGNASSSFYYLTSTEAVWRVLEVWGGEFKDVVEFDEETNEITGCYIKLIQRHGSEHGQRFEIDHNTTEIGRTVLSYPKTALYGRGSSLEIEDEDGEHTGGYTRYIDFADVEWKKSNGDPVDKPLGQKWVGDPEALTAYGYENGTKHRFGIFSNQNYEDKSELLYATWEALQSAKKPEVNYRLSVELFDEKVSLGDTCQAIDRKFARPIEIQARVIAMEYDLMDIEGTMVIEMGQFLDLGDNRIDDLERKVEDIENRPPPPARIDEGSYPNIKPGTPVNVEAYGGMEVIQLYWEYASQIYVKHYEVYGSKTADFIPDSQHLLWRGNTSAFAHTVGTDEVWYYRIRAVNYHGTPSDWSEQVQAATHRVISDDILWGPELAERMRELHRISDIIGENGVNFDQISQEAKDLINQQARIYTDEEIQATRDDIMDELDIRTDDLYDSVADLNQRAQDLINRADGVDDILYDYNVRIDETERGLEFKADSLEVDQINRTVEGHTTEIELLATGLSSKVDEVFVQGAIDGLEIGGRNYALNSDELVEYKSNARFSYDVSDEIKYHPLTKISVSFDMEYTGAEDVSRVEIYLYNGEFLSYAGGNSSGLRENTSIGGLKNGGNWARYEGAIYTVDDIGDKNNITIVVRVRRVAGGFSSEVRVKDIKVEKGNKATDWTPAPEDILSVQENHSTAIDQNSRQISLQAESIVDLDGLITDARAEINIMSEEISERVEKTIFNEETGAIRNSIASVRNFAEGIETTVSSIQIGGTNHLKNTKDFSSNWIIRDGVYTEEDEEVGYRRVVQTDPDISSYLSQPTSVIGFNFSDTNQYFTISVYAKGSAPNQTIGLTLAAGDFLNYQPQTLSEDWELYTWTFKGIGGTLSQFRFNIAGNVSTSNPVKWKKPQILLGNMSSDYQPNFEDTDSRMTQAESSITQLAEDLTFKVDVDSIVSEINVNREGIRLSGALIHLNGLSLIDEAIIQNAHIANGAIDRAKLGTAVVGRAQIEDGAINNAKIANLSADKLNAGAIRGIDVYGARFRSSNGNNWMEIVGGDIHLEQSNGRYVNVSPSGLYGYNAGGSVRFQADSSLVTSAALGTSNLNVYLAAEDTNSLGEVRAVRYSTLGGSGSAADYQYVNVRTRAIKSPPGANAYVGTDGEFRIMSEGLISNGVYRWARATGYYGNTLEVNDGSILYLRSDNRVRTMRTGSSNAYVDLQTNIVHARGIITNSELTAHNFYVGMDGELRVTNKGLGDVYRDVRANNIYANQLQVNTGSILYLRSSNRVRIMSNGSSSAYSDLQANEIMAHSIRVNSETTGDNFYIGAASGELRVTSNSLWQGSHASTIYRGVRASYFDNASSRMYKTNIEPIKNIALDLINGLTVVEYDLKSDLSEGITNNKQVGLISEDSEDVASTDGMAINVYKLTSYNTKAIQELDAKLNEEINWQRIEYQVLKNRVSKLEERIEELEEMVV